MGRRALAAAAGAALLLAGCRPSPEPPPGGPRSGPRVVLLALDGLDPELFRRFLAAGHLPHFRRLVDAGSLAIMETAVGTVSPVVWTTVATGLPPGEHGISGFTAAGSPVTSTLRRKPAFWNILPRLGVRAATVGWLVTWPAEEGAGIVVSERTHWERLRSKVAPRGILDPRPYSVAGTGPSTPPFLARFTDYPFEPRFRDRLERDDPAYAIHFLLQRRLIAIHRRDTIYAEIARRILRERDPEVLAVYFQGADYVSHGFWKYFDPEPFRAAGQAVGEGEVRQLGEIIPRYYAYLDELVGGILELAAADTLVIALSDHGFGPALGDYATRGDFLSGNHRPRALLLLSGSRIADGREQQGPITHFDLLPTLLYALGLPQARDLPGRPLLEYFEPAAQATDLPSIPSYGSRPGWEDRAEASEGDRELLEELRSLGYIQ